MNIFENAINSSRKGDIGEARAIYEYTKMGYVVSRTLFDSAKYELIIDDGIDLKRVQVRTTTTRDGNAYRVELRTTSSNNNSSRRRRREEDDYDILFALTSDDRCWSIPVEELNGSAAAIHVGNASYQEFEL